MIEIALGAGSFISFLSERIHGNRKTRLALDPGERKSNSGKLASLPFPSTRNKNSVPIYNCFVTAVMMGRSCWPLSLAAGYLYLLHPNKDTIKGK